MDIAEDVKGEIEVALAYTWRKWGGWPAVESGMVNMTGVLADSVMAILGKTVLAERERAAKVADEEAEAMLAQRDELLDHGTLGGRKFPREHVKGAAKERRILAEGFQSIATSIRSGASTP